MKKLFLVLLAISLVGMRAQTQEAPTSWYRSVASGNWNTVSVWQSSPTTTGPWLPALAAPTSAASGVEIQGGCTVTMNTSQTIVGLLRLTSGVLNINGNTLTLNGTTSGTGATISGSPTSNLVVGGTATLLFTAGSNLLKDLTVGGGLTLGNALNITAGSMFGTVTVAGLLNSAGFLTLKSDANGTARIAQSTGSITGNVTIERFIPAKRAWRLLTHSNRSTSTQTINQAWQEGQINLSTTVLLNPNPGYGTQITYRDSSDVANGYDANLQRNPSLQIWSGTGWTVPTQTNIPITTHKGYMLFVRGNRANLISMGTQAPTSTTTLRTTGLINQGITTLSTTATVGQYILIGNPYPSTIGIANLLARSATIIDQNTFTLWDPGISLYGGYITHLNGISAPLSTNYPTTASTFFIQSGQAFFVKALIANPSISCIEADKIATSSSSVFARPISVLRVHLRSLQDTLLDGIAIGFGGTKAEGAQKWGTLYEGIHLLRTGTTFGIEFKPLPVDKSDTFFVGFTKLKSQEYVLDVSTEYLRTDKVHAILIDNFLGTTRMFDTTSKYRFVADLQYPDTYKNRFMIVVHPIPASGVTEAIGLYPNPIQDQLHIESNDTLAIVTIYNELGVLVLERKVGDGTIDCSSLASGVYIVKVGDKVAKVIKY